MFRQTGGRFRLVENAIACGAHCQAKNLSQLTLADVGKVKLVVDHEQGLVPKSRPSRKRLTLPPKGALKMGISTTVLRLMAAGTADLDGGHGHGRAEKTLVKAVQILKSLGYVAVCDELDAQLGTGMARLVCADSGRAGVCRQWRKDQAGPHRAAAARKTVGLRERRAVAPARPPRDHAEELLATHASGSERLPISTSTEVSGCAGRRGVLARQSRRQPAQQGRGRVVWSLQRDLGPQAPVWRQRGGVVYDPNADIELPIQAGAWTMSHANKALTAAAGAAGCRALAKLDCQPDWLQPPRFVAVSARPLSRRCEGDRSGSHQAFRDPYLPARSAGKAAAAVSAHRPAAPAARVPRCGISVAGLPDLPAPNLKETKHEQPPSPSRQFGREIRQRNRDRATGAHAGGCAGAGRAGYVLVPGGVNVNAARPVLQVHGDIKCRSHIEAGRAAYYHAGMGEFGHRVGQWLFEECHVIWSEAGR